MFGRNVHRLNDYYERNMTRHERLGGRTPFLKRRISYASSTQEVKQFVKRFGFNLIKYAILTYFS